LDKTLIRKIEIEIRKKKIIAVKTLI